MDFFTAQDNARRKTGWLVFYFLLAVLFLILLTNLLIMATLEVFPFGSPQMGGPRPFDWELFSYISGGVLLVVTGGTYYKISALSRGGDAVAAMFGAEPIFADDADLDHQKLIHVVEEMAIASGTPVPQVYVLHENGINAFAAGFSSSDAVIAVTEGAIRALNREQLQGVIAHEFSHILSGDMRLNIRLVGVLHGILLIGLIGNQILRGSGSSGNSRRGGGGLLLGLGLIVIGYTGTFFGKLIKAAVSRQREFLADSAAVQFTRNPQGIGGALLKIGAHRNGSLLMHAKSDELSHAFFGQGVKVSFAALFATHPRLDERIRRILPDWDGVFPDETPTGGWHKSSSPVPASFSQETIAGLAEGDAVMPHIGRPTRAHLVQAQLLLQDIPEELRKAAGDPFACRALLFYLVLDPQEAIRKEQMQQLKTAADRGVYPETLRLLRTGIILQQAQRLPLVELALPTLRRLSKEQSRLFIENLNTLIRTDGKVNLFEWCLYKIVVQHLEELFQKNPGLGQITTPLLQMSTECRIVISALVNATHHVGLRAVEVYSAAAGELGLPDGAATLLPQFSLGDLDRSLRVLKRLNSQAKGRLIKACIACVVADGKIEPVEAELLRGIAATLSIPIPPLTP